ncbi:type I restriction enzyme HsdR N-terminal domain-containing protein [Aurantibacillus circumpalustris]|uniref:type I restriction enzyme HsdR N-terminal domain-containing protein n=1 Tax=Aurantibacillus circumpalustris TaxID=3036359 RepID=UPI00295A5DA1|nr:type I restriction enzyme HsdR N-terminal domain-containing protein [Aurantibacillus circumpalustris]
MATITQKIHSRISEGLKRFQPIVESAKIRDVSESDTVVMLTGILSEILGYDKYLDITTELAIRGTYCDLALKIDGKLSLLIEAKAIGIELKEPHVKQVVDYAANKGIEWVILTNSVNWRVYKVIFSKPIQNVLVCDVDFLKLRPKANEDIEKIFLLCKEAVSKSSLDDYFTQKQATNRFMIGNLLCEDSILNTLKKELKQIYPDIKVTNDEIRSVLTTDVIKREILTGEESEEAKRKIVKANKKKEKIKADKKVESVPTNSGIEILAKTEDTQN